MMTPQKSVCLSLCSDNVSFWLTPSQPVTFCRDNVHHTAIQRTKKAAKERQTVLGYPSLTMSFSVQQLLLFYLSLLSTPHATHWRRWWLLKQLMLVSRRRIFPRPFQQKHQLWSTLLHAILLLINITWNFIPFHSFSHHGNSHDQCQQCRCSRIHGLSRIVSNHCHQTRQCCQDRTLYQQETNV